MLWQQIKDWFAIGKKCEGLTLIEALLATALLALGMAGVYTISAVSANSMDQSIAKQKMQLQANQILDVIENDVANIDSYVMGLGNCVAPVAGETRTFILRQFEWCSRLTGEVGAIAAGETRSINVTTLVDGRKVVHVLLESNNGKVQIVMKRIYDL